MARSSTSLPAQLWKRGTGLNRWPALGLQSWSACAHRDHRRGGQEDGHQGNAVLSSTIDTPENRKARNRPSLLQVGACAGNCRGDHGAGTCPDYMKRLGCDGLWKSVEARGLIATSFALLLSSFSISFRWRRCSRRALSSTGMNPFCFQSFR